MKKLLGITVAVTALSLTTAGASAATQVEKAPMNNQTAPKAASDKTNAKINQSWDWGNKGQDKSASAKSTASSGQKTVKPSANSGANKAMNKTDKPSPVKAPAKAATGVNQSAN